MKPVIVLLIMIISIPVLGQKNIIEPAAFDKMIVQDITYAIVGEQTPTSGIKLDISKPEATISGVFQRKNKTVALIGFDFKGGITDKNFSILKGYNSFNTAFEFRTSFHMIPAISSAAYGGSEETETNKLIIDLKNKLDFKTINSTVDTFYAIGLIRKRHLGKMYAGKSVPDYLPDGFSVSDHVKELIFYFGTKFFGWTNQYDPHGNLEEQLKAVPVIVPLTGPVDSSKYSDQLMDAYNKYLKLFLGSDDMKLDKQIANASGLWTAKKYWWFTVSPVLRAEKIVCYRTKFDGADSLYFKSDYQFYWGASAYVNHYIVYPNKLAHFFRLGLTAMHTNNLTALTSFTYETRSPIFANATSTAEKTKSGTAYNYNDLKNGFATQINLDYYLLPLNTLIPGLYFSSGLNYSELYKLPNIIGRTNDKTQVSLEGGLVFNLSSREKDKEKSILSLLFYIRTEDITDKRRTDATTGIEESRDDFLTRNLSMGVRVGIPISLPQRK